MTQYSPFSEKKKKSYNEKSEYKQKEITNGMILTGLAHSSYSTPTYVI